MILKKSNQTNGDVDTSNKVNGYALQFDSSVGKFISKALPSGNGSGATSMSGLSDVDVTTIAPIDGNVLTFSSGKWQPKVSISGINLGSYTLELSRWGVSNSVTNFSDSTLSNNNVTGINNALVWAAQQGYVEVVLPKGTYLIPETQGVELQSFLTLNLGGSTLRVRNNGAIGYNIVQVTNNQQYCRVTNGIIEGDKDYHDYVTISSTHEFGVGVMLKYGGSYISVDNLEIHNCTGDAIQLMSSFNVQPGYWGGHDWKSEQVFESGGIDTTTGALVSSTNLIRTSLSFPTTLSMAVQWGYFGLYGDSFGGVGVDITTDTYDCIFYNSNGTFNSSVANIQIWDEIIIPSGTATAKFVLHQANVPMVGNCSLQIQVRTFPKFVYIEKNNLHANRRCAVGLTGCKQVYIRDNDMSYQNGTTPQSASDIEDGYDLNQYIYFERNRMYRNHQYSVTAIAGRHLFFLGNLIGEGIFAIKGGADRTIIKGNIFVNGQPRLIGDTIFTENILYNCSQLMVMDTDTNIIISNCSFRNTSVSINRTKAYCTVISNCNFSYDMDYVNSSNSAPPIVIQGQPQTFTNCTFDGYANGSFLVMSTPITVGWNFNYCTFNNNKSVSNIGLTLPPGTFNRCVFTGTGKIGIGIADASQIQQYQFDNCSFQWSGYQLFYISNNPKIDLLRFNSTRFYGSTDQAIYFAPSGLWGRVEILNSSFEYPSATLSGSAAIIQFYNNTVSIDSLLVQNNTFTANTTLLATDSSKLPSTTVQVFKDNTFKSVNITFHEKALKTNNNINGTIDPYSNLTAVPTAGFYKLAQLLANSNPTAGGYIGWICTQQGYADNSTWSPSSLYVSNGRIAVSGYVYQALNTGTSTSTMPTFPSTPTNGQQVVDNVGLTTSWTSKSYALNNIVIPTTSNGCYYLCTTAGTSGATEPTWKTTGSTTDGTVVWTSKQIITWQEIGQSAVFKQYGFIQT